MKWHSWPLSMFKQKGIAHLYFTLAMSLTQRHPITIRCNHTIYLLKWLSIAWETLTSSALRITHITLLCFLILLSFLQEANSSLLRTSVALFLEQFSQNLCNISFLHFLFKALTVKASEMYNLILCLIFQVFLSFKYFLTTHLCLAFYIHMHHIQAYIYLLSLPIGTQAS